MKTFGSIIATLCVSTFAQAQPTSPAENSTEAAVRDAQAAHSDLAAEEEMGAAAPGRPDATKEGMQETAIPSAVGPPGSRHDPHHRYSGAINAPKEHQERVVEPLPPWQEANVAAETETEPTTPARALPHLRVGAGLGSQTFVRQQTRWFGGRDHMLFNAWLERPLASIISVRAGASLRPASSGVLDLSLFEGQVGARVHWPGNGIWELFYPYGRLDVLLGWAHLSVDDRLADSRFVPGISAGLGVAFKLPKRVSSKLARFYVAVEGAYGLRLPTPFLLEPPTAPEEDEEPFLPGPAIRLGKVDLSSARWLVAVGVGL